MGCLISYATRDGLLTLGTLSMALGDPGELSGYRIAIADVQENDAFYALHEVGARHRGYVLRRFTSADEAKNWLLDAGG